MSNWKTYDWGDLITLEYGKALREYKESEGEVPVYGTNGPIGFTDVPLCPFPSVIIGRKGAYRGVHYSSKPFYVIDTAFFVKPKVDFLDIKFSYYFLKTLDINGMDSGSAIPSTSRSEFYGLSVTLPSKIEQQSIASILSSLDNKIELNLQMNQTLEAMAQAIFKEWFVNFNFPGFDGELEDGLPKGWRRGKIDELVYVKGGSTPSTTIEEYWNGEFYWRTPKDLSNLRSPVLLDTERKISEAGVKQISSGILPKGTLLLSSRAPIGYLAISQVPISINQGYIAMQGKLVSNLFMLFWLKQNMDAVRSRANGSTFQEISKSNFREIDALIPHGTLLKLFDEIITPIFERIVANEIETENLTQIRNSILPKLMTGKIEVKA